MKVAMAVLGAWWLAYVAAAGVTNITHPAYYTWLQDAVNHAHHGDTLWVSTGHYAVSALLLSGKFVRIIGGYSMNFAQHLKSYSEVHPWFSLGDIFWVSGGTVELQWVALTETTLGSGLFVDRGGVVTCQHCRIADNNDPFGGAGVRVKENGGSVVLLHTVVENNRHTSTNGMGGGIAAYGGKVVVGTGSVVRLCSSPTYGGGIAAVDGVSIDVRDGAEVYGNYAADGGGVYVRNMAVVNVLNGAKIWGNTAARYGGGMYAANGGIQIRGENTSVGAGGLTAGKNVATNSGGNVYALGSYVVLADGGQCVNGWAQQYGGGIYVSNSELLVEHGKCGVCDTISEGNSADWGGGIFALHSTVRVRDASELGSNSAGAGGGVWAYGTALEVTDSRVGRNTANLYGGGLALEECRSVIVTNTVVENNQSLYHYGGGLFCFGKASDAVLIDRSTFVSNTAIAGGGIHVDGITLTVRTSRLTGNVAKSSTGGGMRFQRAVATLINVECSSNEATYGGACAIALTSRVVASKVRLNGNRVYEKGGAVYVTGPSVCEIIRDGESEVLANSANWGGGIAVDGGGTARVDTAGGVFHVAGNSAVCGGGAAVEQGLLYFDAGTRVYDNNAVYGAGVFATNGARVVCGGLDTTRTYWYRNIASKAGGAVYGAGDATVVVFSNSTLGEYRGAARGNRADGADGGGGAVAVVAGAQYEAINCVLAHNVSSNYGGAIYVNQGVARVASSFTSGAVLEPLSRVANNSAQYGGAGYAFAGELHFSAAMITSNRSSGAGGGVTYSMGAGTLVNCVLARNTAPNGGAVDSTFLSSVALAHCTVVENGRHGIVADLGGICSVTNCIVYGNASTQVSTNQTVRYSDVEGGYPGVGNIDANPLFVNPAQMDYQLSFLSPCRDTGTWCGVTHDILGMPRSYGARPDMGAYEFVPEPTGALGVMGLMVGFALLNLFTKATTGVATCTGMAGLATGCRKSG